MSMWSLPTFIIQLFSETASAITGEQPSITPTDTTGQTPADIAKARTQLAYLGLGTLAVIGAPTIYAAALNARKGRKKRKLSENDMMIGRSLENASTQATGLLMTGLASPVIACVLGYVLVQKLEDAKYITTGLGNAAQTLMSVSAAAPMIQGIGQVAGSAFKAAK